MKLSLFVHRLCSRPFLVQKYLGWSLVRSDSQMQHLTLLSYVSSPYPSAICVLTLPFCHMCPYPSAICIFTLPFCHVSSPYPSVICILTLPFCHMCPYLTLLSYVSLPYPSVIRVLTLSFCHMYLHLTLLPVSSPYPSVIRVLTLCHMCLYFPCSCIALILVDILLLFYFLASIPSSHLAPLSPSIVRSSGVISDKIFVAAGSEVKGYSKKGNNFLTLDTNLAESLQSV